MLAIIIELIFQATATVMNDRRDTFTETNV